MKNLAAVASLPPSSTPSARRPHRRGALAEFIADYAATSSRRNTAGSAVCIVGSERGFCGDLNQQRLHRLRAELIAPRRPVERHRQRMHRPRASCWSATDSPTPGATPAHRGHGRPATLPTKLQNILADLVATLHAIDARQPGAQPPLPHRNRPGPSGLLPRPMPGSAQRATQPSAADQPAATATTCSADRPVSQNPRSAAPSTTRCCENQLRLSTWNRPANASTNSSKTSPAAATAPARKNHRRNRVILLSSIAAESAKRSRRRAQQQNIPQRHHHRPRKPHPLVDFRRRPESENRDRQSHHGRGTPERRDTPRPVPRHPLHWVAACAGTTGWGARPATPANLRPPPPPPPPQNAHPLVIPAKAESNPTTRSHHGRGRQNARDRHPVPRHPRTGYHAPV